MRSVGDFQRWISADKDTERGETDQKRHHQREVMRWQRQQQDTADNPASYRGRSEPFDPRTLAGEFGARAPNCPGAIEDERHSIRDVRRNWRQSDRKQRWVADERGQASDTPRQAGTKSGEYQP